MKIDIVNSDEGDWTGLYVDGRLMCEGHSLSPREVIEALGFELNSSQSRYLADIGYLPISLEDALKL